jgi:hypothetical protein
MGVEVEDTNSNIIKSWCYYMMGFMQVLSQIHHHLCQGTKIWCIFCGLLVKNNSFFKGDMKRVTSRSYIVCMYVCMYALSQ